jgi:hypothetical protein
MADTAPQHISTERKIHRHTCRIVSPTCHQQCSTLQRTFLHRLGTYSSRVLRCWSVREAPPGEPIRAEQSKKGILPCQIRNICDTPSHTSNGHVVEAIAAWRNDSSIGENPVLRMKGWLSGGNRISKFHMPTDYRARNFPLASSLLNLDIAVFREAPTDNTKQTTSPGTQLLPLLLYLISLVRPSSSHPDLLLTNPNDRTLPTSEAPYKRYVSNYHMLHLFRSHGMAPTSLLHPTSLRFSPRALPLLSLHYYCHIPHNHLSFI